MFAFNCLDSHFEGQNLNRLLGSYTMVFHSFTPETTAPLFSHKSAPNKERQHIMLPTNQTTIRSTNLKPTIECSTRENKNPFDTHSQGDIKHSVC